VVKAEDSQLSGCGFEPRRRILDGVSKASYYKLQWKKEIKLAKWGTPKKYLKKILVIMVSKDDRGFSLIVNTDCQLIVRLLELLILPIFMKNISCHPNNYQLMNN
jgi:hypothetical protein